MNVKRRQTMLQITDFLHGGGRTKKRRLNASVLDTSASSLSDNQS